MRLRLLLALLPLAFASLSAGVAAADTAPPSFPILPNQFFSGAVNGRTADAVIHTACPGPSTPGRTGHPVAGQTVAVIRVVTPPPPTTANLGFTGSAGTSVAALPSSSITNNPVLFVEYSRTQALPTTWTVPCDGFGRIAFTPRPTSSTARTAFLTVQFINIAV